MKFKLNQNVLDKIEVLNIKNHQICGYKSNDIYYWLNELQENATVTVGYRTACGASDKTHKTFRIWLSVIKLIKKEKIEINEKNLIVANSSPTMAQGFWNEIRYFLN